MKKDADSFALAAYLETNNMNPEPSPEAVAAEAREAAEVIFAQYDIGIIHEIGQTAIPMAKHFIAKEVQRYVNAATAALQRENAELKEKNGKLREENRSLKNSAQFDQGLIGDLEEALKLDEPELRQRLAAAEADTRRLDWLDGQCPPTGLKRWGVVTAVPENTVRDAIDESIAFREAIDAASGSPSAPQKEEG